MSSCTNSNFASILARGVIGYFSRTSPLAVPVTKTTAQMAEEFLGFHVVICVVSSNFKRSFCRHGKSELIEPSLGVM